MPDLPSGTVTFLFTDIVGSTKLWEAYPEAMRVALARHDALQHHAIESNNGIVFKTVGDAFCAAFATAPMPSPPPSVPNVRSTPNPGLTLSLCAFAWPCTRA